MVFQSSRRISQKLNKKGGVGFDVGSMPKLKKLVINVNFTDRQGNNTLTKKLSRQEKQLIEEHLEEIVNQNPLDFSQINDVDVEQIQKGKHHFVVTFTFTNPTPADQVDIMIKKYIQTGREKGFNLEDGIEYIFDQDISAEVPEDLKSSMPVLEISPGVSKVQESQSPAPSSLSSETSSESLHQKHYGPFMCALNAKGTRCVAGAVHDSEHCRLNENNNCALALGHKVIKRSLRADGVKGEASPKKATSKRAVGETKPNRWIEHVKAYQLTHPGMKWFTALKESRSSYNKQN
jgi:hypothetical protein